LNYRESERFPTCTTFKVLAAGALPVRVDAGREAEMTPAICSLRRRSGGSASAPQRWYKVRSLPDKNLHIEISDFISVAVDAFALST
jgi:hypothetical protein